MTETTRTLSVDRIEGRTDEGPVVVLVSDDGYVVEIPATALHAPPCEGWVLRVPVEADQLLWALAVRDNHEEERRRVLLRLALDRMRTLYPSEDITF